MQGAAEAVSPRELVLGRYRPLRPLGSGGSGSVWLTHDETSGLQVALKIVAREGTAGSRAEREASAAAQLRHPHCLRAYALARDQGHVYIAYEYVPGTTLRHALRAGELDDEAALEAAAQIADALAVAHDHGIVHRDVKPSNVLLAEGPYVSVKLLDFGLALIREEETLTAAGDIPGTLAYISPERLKGESAGPAADVWSLGVLLWEALAGRHPFTGGTLVETAKQIGAGAPSLQTERPDLPRSTIALVDRALAVDPARRPSAEKVAADLRRAADAPARRAAPNPGRLAQAATRVVPAGLAALFAGWTASALPFYPAHWPAAIAVAAGLVTLAGARAGLVLALAAPVFPLGNLSFGLAALYGAVALAWLVLYWRAPRGGLAFAVGPLLAPAGLLGLAPLAFRPLRGVLQRCAMTAAAVLAAGAAGALPHAGSLRLAGSRHPLTVAHVLWRALAADRALAFEALALVAIAALLPLARGRGPWPIAGAGAALLASSLVAFPNAPALPIVLAVWAGCAGLALEPVLRNIRR